MERKKREEELIHEREWEERMNCKRLEWKKRVDEAGMVFILTYHNFSIQSEDLPHEFAYMDKDLPHRHMTNSGNWILTAETYLHNGCKDRDYFLHFKKIGTNFQNGRVQR